MNITEEDIRRIVREEIEAYFRRSNPAASGVEEPKAPYHALKDADEELVKRAMDAMDATLGEQENPKVGIFWYSPQLQDVFGVVAIDAATAPKSGHSGLRTCKELHKYIWKKQFNYDKAHNVNSPFRGDYKYTPRGRVFYDDELDEYHIMVGAWLNDYPEAKPLIRAAFNLTDPNLHVTFERGIHWEIGMGYGE
jgi:hypothetical protein